VTAEQLQPVLLIAALSTVERAASSMTMQQGCRPLYGSHYGTKQNLL
jgi:hypothetical protein